MELILAEKPSAARNFAKALGGKTGNYAGTEYKITNLRGHVMGLLPPDKQVPTEKVEFYKSWDLENLPWNLNDFAWKKGILSGCKDIISGLKDELKEADCVVIATDVDPSGEGELLAWEALEKCGWRGTTKRMYFADEAPASVQKAFRERKTLPSMDKDGDYVKAVVRERWDLASMQFTRAATLVARKKGFRTVVRQGRLKSVMVKLTGDQLKAYNEYVRKPFYEARFKDENGNIFARKTDDPEDIRFDSPDQVDLSQLHDSAVVEDSRGKKHTAPGKLLDLAGLSAILAKQGFKPANVLKTYQEMYENQIVSYPRTEDKEVTPEQFGELLPLVDKIASVVGVDTSLLSHRAARKTHVKEGGAHGANRPGINVPESLAELENGYGKIGSAIYSVLAKNYLAMLAEDYEYELIKGHVRDFPEYVGQTQIPIKPGFKAIFDSDSSSTEKSEGEEAENACEFGKVASPYVHEGANKRPQKPTMKWLTKKLEKYNVGTGATRTSTLAEITANEERALMKENKGALTMTKCGEVSYALLANCQIASPEVTEKLFESMNEVGRFSRKPSDVINTVTDMVCRPFLQYLDLSSNLGFLGSQFRHLSILLFQLVSELGFRLGCVPVCKLFNGCDLFLLLSHLLLELTKRHLSSFTFLCKSRTLVFRKVNQSQSLRVAQIRKRLRFLCQPVPTVLLIDLHEVVRRPLAVIDPFLKPRSPRAALHHSFRLGQTPADLD